MIGDEGVKALVEPLRQSHSLGALSLSKWKYKILESDLIGAEGGKHIGELIKSSKTLCILYLSNCLLTLKIKTILEISELKH
jgi:hypothetical protein